MTGRDNSQRFLDRLSRTTIERGDGKVELERFHYDKLRDLVAYQAAEIERLREALVTVRARIEDIENPFEDGTRQEHTAFEKAVDAAQLIAMEVLEKTLHVAETCKENGETFT